MLKFLKKPWLAVSLVLVALSLSVAYAGCGCGAKKTKEKPNQIVLDKIVNELVCQHPSVGFKGAPQFGMQVARGDKYWC